MDPKEKLEDLNRPIYNIGDIAVILCEMLSCENCPVTIYKCDNRTEYEKQCLHVTCCEQLMNWIENESKSNRSQENQI